MATNIVPKFETPLPPKRFFTADKKDYTTIMNWLGGNKLEYETFYASFLNHTIITARSAVDPKKKGSLTQKDNALIWIFDDVPVQTQGFLDAMSAYGEDHWDRGITYGTIDLEDGRKATTADIESAHKLLAQLLYSNDQQKKYKAERPQLVWLFENPKAVQKRQKKKQKRGERKVTDGLSGLDLDEDAEQNDAK